MTAYFPEFAGAAAAIAWTSFVIQQARVRLREGRLVMRGGRQVKRKDEPGKFSFLFCAGLAAALTGVFLSFFIFRSLARIIWP